MTCSYCRSTIENPRKGQRFCDNICRAADWRERHLPRCPNCNQPIRVDITAVPEPRSERLQHVTEGE